jgi:hypothetical protein
MTYRKKLIEVALPLEAINKESAQEKSIRHGHPSTLHLWWVRRPCYVGCPLEWEPNPEVASLDYDIDESLTYSEDAI